MLNNKGFAISVILYSVTTVILTVLMLILAVTAANVHNNNKLADTAKEQLYNKDIEYYNILKEQDARDITISSVRVDGLLVKSLPTSGTYTLSNYTCKKNSTLTWNTYEKSITFSTLNKGDVCTLEFTTSTNYPLLTSIAKQGDYVAYVGNNGCMLNGIAVTGDGEAESGNSCLGENANSEIDTNGNTYGYCNDSRYKYYVTGWRIAYIENSRAFLVSAGSPECNTRTASTANATYISEANAKALKYCNSSFVDGNCSDNSDSWAINDTDFYKITNGITNGQGSHLTGYYNSSNKCTFGYSKYSCGYNNTLIDNGGYYWFAAIDSYSNTYGVNWYAFLRIVHTTTSTSAYGIRPIIKLSTNIYVTGGNGTSDDPYTIIKK